MERWPEFVKDIEDGQSCLSGERTGWEAVVFELQDLLGEVIDTLEARQEVGLSSDDSTAAFAP